MNKELRVASVELKPWVEFMRNEDGKIVDGKGFCFEILKAIMESSNFTIKIQTPEDNKYGAQLEDGTWTGMIAMVLNNVSDVAVGSFSLTYPRYLVIDFTTAFYEEPSAILIRAPTQEKQLFALAKPFQSPVWISLFSVMTVISFVLWIPTAIKTHHKIYRERNRFDHVFLFTYALLLTQSGHRFGTASRLLITFWCLSTVVFIHAYVGTLISFLSIPILKPALSSLAELSSSGLGGIVWRGTDLDSLFMEAQEGLYRRIGDEFRKHPERMVDSPFEGLGFVMNGSYVNMNSKSYLEWMIEEDFINSDKTCRFSLAKETFNKIGQSFVVTKGSPLKAIFDRKITRLLESGLMEYWISKYITTKGYCRLKTDKESRALHPVSLGDIRGAFFLWIIGLGLAFLAFIIEHLLLQCPFLK